MIWSAKIVIVVGENMKKKFLKYATELIKEYYPETDDIRMDEYRYSLEAYYITITKSLVILPLAFLLGVFKEIIILLIFFNILREQAHGLHASKSSICLISSAIMFIGAPILSKKIVIPFILKIIIGIIGIILMYRYAPADTIKAPIIKEEKRKKYKFNSTIICIIYTFIYLFINNTISNIIIFSIWIQIFLILPITYKLFHLSYDNYKTYLLNMD